MCQAEKDDEFEGCFLLVVLAAAVLYVGVGFLWNYCHH